MTRLLPHKTEPDEVINLFGAPCNVYKFSVGKFTIDELQDVEPMDIRKCMSWKLRTMLFLSYYYRTLCPTFFRWFGPLWNA